MDNQRPNSSLNLLHRFVVISALVTLAAGNLSSLQVGGQTQPGRPRRATVESSNTPATPPSSRDQQPPDMMDETDRRTLKKENATVIFAFIVMQPFLPTGARVTSGFRNAQDQLALIGRMARRAGYSNPTASMSLEKQETWMPPLMFLRGKGYKVAGPHTTPHSSDVFTVFDISGDNLDQIKAGCYKAAEHGLIEIHRTIYEAVNDAIHIELELTEKAAKSVGYKPEVAWTLTSNSNAADSNVSDAAATPFQQEERRALFEKLKAQHDASSLDPLKQIDYDLQLEKLFDPANDPQAMQAIKALDDEIKEHRDYAAQLAQNGGKEKAANEIKAALQDGRLADAEQAAQKFTESFPNEPKAKLALDQVKTMRLVNEAIDMLIKGECSDCAEAEQRIDKAIAVSPGDPSAQRIKGEVSACLAGCRSSRTAFIILVVLFAAGAIVGLYFLIGPKKWVLEGVYGPCQGKVFSLNKQKMKIGAVDSPEDEIDIVISDPKHKISRLHCSLRLNGRHWYLKDKSSNGTKINDVKMDKERYVKLRNGDEISLADEATLQFRPK